jgi:pathogenesis-related protein 1
MRWKMPHRKILKSGEIKMLIRTAVVISLCLLSSIAIDAQKNKPTKVLGPAPKKITAGKCGPNKLTMTEISDLVAAHDKVRAEVKLGPLTWDCRLADQAQQWADKGKFEHREFSPDGENLFVSSDTAEPISTVTTRWFKEKDYWNNSTRACLPGKFCTHYTQMVWNKTTHVGCGINRNAPGKWKVLVVCNYSPAGNTGGAPY